LLPVREGALVAIEGILLRATGDGVVVVPRNHLEGPVDVACHMSDDFSCNIGLVPGSYGEIGEHVHIVGMWTAGRVRPTSITAHAGTGADDDVWAPLPPGPSTKPPLRRHPTPLELQLSREGSVAGELWLADGTLRVAAHDVTRVEELLRPIHGDRLHVRQAMYGPSERGSLRAIVSLAEQLGVHCSSWESPVEYGEPETIPALAVSWVPSELAEAINALPVELAELETHVVVLT